MGTSPGGCVGGASAASSEGRASRAPRTLGPGNYSLGGEGIHQIVMLVMKGKPAVCPVGHKEIGSLAADRFHGIFLLHIHTDQGGRDRKSVV